MVCKKLLFVSLLKIFLTKGWNSQIFFFLREKQQDSLIWLHKECKMMLNKLTLDTVFVTKAKQKRWIITDCYNAQELGTSPNANINFEKDFSQFVEFVKSIAKFLKNQQKVQVDEEFEKNFIQNETVAPLLRKVSFSDSFLNDFVELEIVKLNPFAQIMNFLDNLKVKKAGEKETFFKFVFSFL